MNGVIERAVPCAGLAISAGILLTLGLLLFVSVLAGYRAHATEPRPLLVVELSAWPTPPKQVKPAAPAKAEKQPLPEKTVEKKPPPPPKPTHSPPAKKVVKEVSENAVEPAPEEDVVDKAEPRFTEPSPPMLIEPAEDALPKPVPIFRLTQAPRFLHRADPVYPEAMRTQGISGMVKLEALIDKEGRVRKVSILKSAGKAFDEAARRAILASSFYPAEVENKPVAVLLRLPVRFELF